MSGRGGMGWRRKISKGGIATHYFFEIFLGKNGGEFFNFLPSVGKYFTFSVEKRGNIFDFSPYDREVCHSFPRKAGDSDPVLTSDGEVRHSFDWTDDPDK